ncbi:MAG: GTP-binding protein [Bacteroidales bacterium]|nr:GTP-binding protein [Candidatus Scybalocola fimicaballi]
MEAKSTPVLLLTGYLGSGKTTLVNHILSNKRGIKFAVVVNDIGEVNIDADLIQKGGIVDKKDDSLVALQNGCICCTLKMDLVEQINEILQQKKFDYIVIEASGVCEPVPIAQTLVSLQQMSSKYTGKEACFLDSIVTVVDALRLQSEFECGDALKSKSLDEEDIENLVIQQIEFCNIILLNKASEVEKSELARIKEIIKTLQPYAEIIECDYADVDLDKIINTGRFQMEKAAISAGWIKELERPLTEEEKADAEGHYHHHDENEDEDHEHHCHHHHHHDDDDDHECHCHHHDHDHDDDDHECEHHHHHHHEDGKECDDPHCCCHHHHHHDGGEVEEYGIGTFVYYRRPAFNLDKFEAFVSKKWAKNIIRTKGVCYFNVNPEMSYLFEQAGVQKKVTEAGQWFCTAPEEELKEILAENPEILNDWDEKYGDKMQKIVFIGQKMDKEKIIAELDACLEK